MGEEKKGFHFGNIIEIIGSLLFLTLLLLAIGNITTYLIFQRKWGQVEELITILFVWITYIGVGELYRSDEHIRVDLLEKFLPKIILPYLSFIVRLLNLVISAVITYFAIVLCIVNIKNVSSVLKLSFTYINVSLAIGFGLSVIYMTIDFIKIAMSRRKKKEISTSC